MHHLQGNAIPAGQHVQFNALSLKTIYVCYLKKRRVVLLRLTPLRHCHVTTVSTDTTVIKKLISKHTVSRAYVVS